MEYDNRYCQEAELSREERKKMYMALEKEVLADMLAERDEVRQAPSEYYPVNLKTGKVCRSWSDCTNPNMDCINCPLRYGGSNEWVTNFTEDRKIMNGNLSNDPLNVK